MNITPKNWASFQHYKDRAPSWIKLHRGLLDDYAFSRLPVASRALAPLLWLLASEYEGGKITSTLDELAFRLHTTPGEVAEALNPLIEAGFFTTDSAPLAQCKQPASLEKRREQEELDKTPSAREYVFNGGIIKLAEKHWRDWTDAYPNLDLRGELTARDAWLGSDRATDSDRRNWFISTSKYLANRNMEARAKTVALQPSARPLTPSGQPWPDGII